MTRVSPNHPCHGRAATILRPELSGADMAVAVLMSGSHDNAGALETIIDLTRPAARPEFGIVNDRVVVRPPRASSTEVPGPARPFTRSTDHPTPVQAGRATSQGHLRLVVDSSP